MWATFDNRDILSFVTETKCLPVLFIPPFGNYSEICINPNDYSLQRLVPRLKAFYDTNSGQIPIKEWPANLLCSRDCLIQHSLVILPLSTFWTFTIKTFNSRLTCESALLSRLLDSASAPPEHQGHTALLYILVSSIVKTHFLYIKSIIIKSIIINSIIINSTIINSSIALHPGIKKVVKIQMNVSHSAFGIYANIV